MNNWLDFIEDATSVIAIYGDNLPTLEGVDLHEVSLHRDGPRVHLRFDLPVFPGQPPKKWSAANFNRVQLRLIAVGVQDLQISGLQSTCVLDLKITKETKMIRLHADNGQMKIDICAEHFIVDSISAYRST